MQPFSTRAVGLLLSIAAPVLAQNTLQHHDGTNEATSRGAAGVAPKTVLQRYPDDQACGRTALSGVSVVIQDQAIATPEMFMLEVRTALPPLGAPDMAPAGLLAAVGPFVPVFPPPGPVSAVLFSVAFAVPLALPPSGAGIASDFHVGLAFPPSPAWPADGISVQCSGSFFVPPSVGEQMSPAAVGYTGVAGAAGLAWEFNAATGVVAASAGNRAWDIAPDLVDDVCQPLADNAPVFTGIPYAGVAGTGTGLNPNFGYAGLFPVLARGDGLAWRVRASSPVGSPTVFLLNTATMPPLAVPGLFDGSLCVALAGMVLIPGPLTVAGMAPPGTSEAVLGPFAIAAAPGLMVYAQAATVDLATATVTVSTMCRTLF